MHSSLSCPPRERIHVSVRIKPILQSPWSSSSSSSSRKHNNVNDQKQSSSPPQPSSQDSIENWIVQKCQSFATNVWSTQTQQSKVYNDFMEGQFLPAFEKGLNCTCFLYGQTGSGKTYSLFGPPDRFQVSSSSEMLSMSLPESGHDNYPPYWGIFPRCISYFLNIKRSIYVSMVELYQDQCYDLLNHHTRVQLKKNSSTYRSTVSTVGAKYDSNGKWIPPFLNGKENVVEVDLQGQKEIQIRDNEELMSMCQLLESSRHTSAHALNSRSSRSHCIVNVKVVQEGNEDLEQIIRFVDLAGSEKIKQTKSSGQVLDEAKSINTSLSALGRVLVQLNEGMEFVSYRDSPLTVLLQDALRGKDETSIIVTVDSQSIMKLETRSSLSFAERCAKVKGRKHRQQNRRRIATTNIGNCSNFIEPSGSRVRRSTLPCRSERKREDEVKSIQNALKVVQTELNALKLRNAHGRNNLDFPNSIIKTFTVNKQKLQYHMNQLAQYKQNLLEMKGAQSSKIDEETASFKKDYEMLKKQIENENIKVTNLKGLVLRQMTTGVWIPPKQSYTKKMLEKRELQKKLRRMNVVHGVEVNDNDDDSDDFFATIENLMLDFKG